MLLLPVQDRPQSPVFIASFVFFLPSPIPIFGVFGTLLRHFLASTNYMHQRSYSEPYSLSGSQQFPRHLWNQNIHYCIYSSPLLSCIHSSPLLTVSRGRQIQCTASTVFMKLDNRGSIPSRGERFSSSFYVQTGFGGRQPPIQWVQGVFSSRVKGGRGVTLNNDPHLMPRSRKSRSYTISLPGIFNTCTGDSFTLSLLCPSSMPMHAKQSITFR
jgi:hypothetical protein